MWGQIRSRELFLCFFYLPSYFMIFKIGIAKVYIKCASAQIDLCHCFITYHIVLYLYYVLSIGMG